MKKSKNKKQNTQHRFVQNKPVVFSKEFHITTNFYHNNMRALKKHYPDLAQKVEQCPFTNRYQIIPSLNSFGTPNLLNMENKFLYYDPKDPLKDAEAQIESLKLKNAKIAVILGIGLGYETVHFTMDVAMRVKTQHVIVFEKDMEIFKLACCYTNLVPVIEHPRSQFVINAKEDDLFIILKNYISGEFRYALLKSLKAVYHPSSLRLNKQYYLKVLTTITEIGRELMFQYGNSPEDSLIGIQNMLANLSVIVKNPGINQLFDKFIGHPAIVVATGPSLNKNKHLLKGLEKRALIISVDASLKILLRMGVQPHLVTSLERVPAVARFFEDIPPEDIKDIYLTAAPVIRREVYDLYSGPKIIVYRKFDHFKWLGIDKGMLDIKASSGNMAFKIAAALGCDPIILIGQDLAYSRDGFSHAAGSPFGEKQSAYKEEIFVPGNDGEPIATHSTWYSFLKGYEIDLKEYSGTCINATEGGAFIKGTRVMTFQEAIDRYIQNEFFPLKVIRKNLATPDEKKIITEVKHVLKNCRKTAEELNTLISICDEAINLILENKNYLQRIISEDSTKDENIGALYKEILETKRKRIISYQDTFQLFFMHVFQSYNIKFEIDVNALADKHENENALLADMILHHEEWYSTLKHLADICRNELHIYQARLSLEFPLIEM